MLILLLLELIPKCFVFHRISKVARLLEDSQAIIEEKQKGKQSAGRISGGDDDQVRAGPSIRRYGNYGKPGHNARTCEEDAQDST